MDYAAAQELLEKLRVTDLLGFDLCLAMVVCPDEIMEEGEYGLDCCGL